MNRTDFRRIFDALRTFRKRSKAIHTTIFELIYRVNIDKKLKILHASSFAFHS